jgi:Spy/CpxP family protein refolding chaperone
MKNVTRCIAALALALVPAVGVAQAPKAERKADVPPVRGKVQQKLQQTPVRGRLLAGFAALKLTPEQKERLQDIRAKAREKVEAIRGEKELTPPQQRTRASVARADALAEAQKVLTPEQQKKVRAAIERRRGASAQARPGLKGRPGGPVGARRWMHAPPAGRPWMQAPQAGRPWMQGRPGMQGPPPQGQRPWFRGRMQQGGGWF